MQRRMKARKTINSLLSSLNAREILDNKIDVSISTVTNCNQNAGSVSVRKECDSEGSSSSSGDDW